jgi:uncharacterized BrkB/YihY/UPF0761 family membrane protein
MLHKKIILLLLMGAAVSAALWFNGFLKQKINPYGSTRNGLLYLLLHLLAIVILVFAVGFVIIYYREFFFKQ